MTNEEITPLADFARRESEIVESHKDGNDATGIVDRAHPTIEEWRKFVGTEIRRDPALEPNQWIDAMACMFAVMALEATSIFPERKTRSFAMTKLIRKMATMICEVFDGTMKVEDLTDNGGHLSNEIGHGKTYPLPFRKDAGRFQSHQREHAGHRVVPLIRFHSLIPSNF